MKDWMADVIDAVLAATWTVCDVCEFTETDRPATPRAAEVSWLLSLVLGNPLLTVNSAFLPCWRVAPVVRPKLDSRFPEVSDAEIPRSPVTLLTRVMLSVIGS